MRDFSFLTAVRNYISLLGYDPVQPGELVADISEAHPALFLRVESHATQHRNSEDYDLILGDMG